MLCINIIVLFFCNEISVGELCFVNVVDKLVIEIFYVV
jgi:hypothetical protein